MMNHEFDVELRALFRTPYNYSMEMVSEDTGLTCSDKSRTKQEFKEDSDINVIMVRFGQGHDLPTNLRVPLSGDFSEAGDFTTAMDRINEARAAFAQMPSQVRRRFRNDPAEFVAFVEDGDNRDEARKLGLLVPDAPPPAPVEPMLVRIAPDNPPAGGGTSTST